MKAAPSMKSLTTGVAIALLLGSVNGHAADALVGSFDRMLGHQTGPTRPVTNADRDLDPLHHAVAILLRGHVQAAPASDDPIAASFVRMLVHTPSAIASAVPSGQAADPLAAAMVEPLRQSLSASAGATHFASVPRSGAEH